MGLRTKFSLILSACALISVLFSSLAQTRAFTSDQQTYLSDFQSSISLSIERQIALRGDLLYSRAETAVLATDGLESFVFGNPLILSAQVWENGALIAKAPPSASSGDAPPTRSEEHTSELQSQSNL